MISSVDVFRKYYQECVEGGQEVQVSIGNVDITKSEISEPTALCLMNATIPIERKGRRKAPDEAAPALVDVAGAAPALIDAAGAEPALVDENLMDLEEDLEHLMDQEQRGVGAAIVEDYKKEREVREGERDREKER